jgi:hypothetical protein
MDAGISRQSGRALFVTKRLNLQQPNFWWFAESKETIHSLLLKKMFAFFQFALARGTSTWITYVCGLSMAFMDRDIWRRWECPFLSTSYVLATSCLMMRGWDFHLALSVSLSFKISNPWKLSIRMIVLVA